MLAIVKNADVNMGKNVHLYTDFCFLSPSTFIASEIEWAEVIKWDTEILVVKFTVDPGRILSSSISWKTHYLAFTISWNLEVHDFFLLRVFSWSYRWPRLVKSHTYHSFSRRLGSLQLFPVWCHSIDITQLWCAFFVSSSRLSFLEVFK